MRDGFARDKVLLRRARGAAPPAVAAGAGRPRPQGLAAGPRGAQTRELEVEVSRVAGVTRCAGINLFAARAAATGGGCPPSRADGAQILALQAWQLPELLSVVAVDATGAPAELTRAAQPVRRCQRRRGAGRSGAVLMDANGLRFWMLADGRHFPPRSHAVWDASAGCCGWRASARCRRRAASPHAFAIASRRTGAHAARASTRSEAWHTGSSWRTPTATSEPWSWRARICPTRRSARAGGDARRPRRRLRRRAVHRAGGPRAACTICAAAGPTKRFGSPASSPGAWPPMRRGGVWVIERASGRLARLERSAAAPLRRRPTTTTRRRFGRARRTAAPAGGTRAGCEWCGHPASGRSRLPRTRNRASRCCPGWTAGQARLRRLDADTATLAAPISLPDARYAYALDLARRRAVSRCVMPGRRDAPAFDA